MFTLNDFTKYKQQNKKITMITCYDYFSSQIVASSGIDTILVGDSLGMVIQGKNNTLDVTMEDIIYHGQAVTKGAPNTFVIVDMPYLSYHVSITDSIKNAGHLLQKTNASAVKIEINSLVTLDHVKAIIDAQIPVIGHIGMTPQSVNMFGGFKPQGKTLQSEQKIIELANKLEHVGISALVLECIPSTLAKQITTSINLATIGIGAGPNCDGQVLVFHDMLGFDPSNKIKFVKKFANANQYLSDGIKQYITEVRNLHFPSENHVY